jgi:hypothetical protein
MTISRLQLLLIICAACLLTAAVANWRAENRGSTMIPTAGEAPAPHRVNLDTRLVEFRVNSETLEQVADDLAKKTGESFAIDWAKLTYGTLFSSSNMILPVTLELRNVTLGEALTALVRRLSPDPYQIDYTVSGGIITFTQSGGTYTVPVTRVYDVRDLIERQRAFMRQRNLPSTKSPAVLDSPVNEYQAAADWVVANADEVVSQRGEHAQFSELAGRLIVTTTADAHASIQQLFDELRRDSSPARSAP